MSTIKLSNSSQQIKLLPKLTNKQHDYVEEQARQRHFSLTTCPTCGSKEQEVEGAPGIGFRPNDTTYKLYGEYYPCDCEWQIELLWRYIASDIPKGYWRLGVDEYWGDPSAMDAISNFLKNRREYVKNGIGMTIYSPLQGVGKTMLASILAKDLIKSGEHVVFISFRDAINLYSLSDEDRHEKVSKLRNTPFLVLDEVGSGLSDAQKGFMSNELESLIRFRVSGNSSTIITTNMTMEQLDKEYPRSFSLLAAKQIEVKVEGVDARKNGDNLFIDLELINAGEVRPLV